MVLRGIARDLPDLVGADIAALRPRRRHHRPVVLGTHGVASALQEIQVRNDMGPVLSAASAQRSVTSADLWHDHRWPKLDLRRACQAFPQHSHTLRKARGVVVVPGLRDDGSLIVVSTYLAGGADDAVADVVSRYERLVASAVAAMTAFSGPEERTQRVLAVLQSRDEVQRATGIVMGLCRINSFAAQRLLTDIAERSDLRLQVLAAELTRVTGEPPEHQGATAIADRKAHRIATELLSSLHCGDPRSSRTFVPDRRAGDVPASEREEE